MKIKSGALILLLLMASANTFAQTQLKYKVLNGTPFNNVVQTVIYGDQDAVLIDAGLFNSDAHRAVAAILDLRKNLTTIYITHPDADHYFGLDVLIKAFPDARVVALPQVADDIMTGKDAALKIWKGLYKDYVNNFPKDASLIQITKIGTPDGATIELEGNELKVVGMQRGDQEHSSFVWVDALKMIVSGDIVYNMTYPWTSGTTAEARARWIKSVDNIIAYHPAIVVAGHKDPAAADSVAGAVFTKAYLKFYDQQLLKHPSKEAFVAAIKKKFPVKVSDLALLIALPETFPDQK